MFSTSYIRSKRASFLSLFLLTNVLLLAFCSCTGNSSSTVGVPTAAPLTTKIVEPTPTSPPVGTVLYQADVSHGLTNWQQTHGWKVVQGQLETSSGAVSTFTLPYRPSQANYAIEMRIQIVRLLTDQSGYFFIFATQAQDKDGYQAEVGGLRKATKRPNGDHPSARVMIDPASSQAQGTGIPIDFEPGFAWHTYRVEVRDNLARLFVDGSSAVYANSQQTDTLSNGPLGLTCEQLILHVSAIRITTL